MIVTTPFRTRLGVPGKFRALFRSLLLVMFASTVACSDDLFTVDAFRLNGTLNGDAVNVPASALLMRGQNAPDSLFLGGELHAAYLSLKIEYLGPGTYALSRDNTELVLLVGGDVRTGYYRGVAPRAGDLVITEDNGPGGEIEAQLWFDAEHAANEQRFGPTVAFRSGQLRAQLRVYQRP